MYILLRKEKRYYRMKTARKLASLLCASVLLLGAGCTKTESSTSIPDFSYPENPLGAASQLIPDVTTDKFPVPENEGMSFVKNLKLGWNLGNTFDAVDMKNISAENELDYEKGWCGSITTIDNIAAIKAAGFSTIRIPVSWHNHVDENNQISAKWMARVKEVVDWCRACDLYVIVNVHHDNGEDWYFPDNAHMEKSKNYLTSVWKQIAETFRDYDEHLILESLNEPRLVNTNYEWWIDKNNAQCKEAIQCINELNQLFVDTVRASGGTNATRWLLCPGYAASADGALNDGFAVPNDAANRVIVSVHAYTPYDFALNKTGTKEFSSSNESNRRSITDFMDDLYAKFVQNGTPVLIGEFGAMNKDNLEARVDFAAFYIAAARAHGISCCWWDNNAFSGSGENFGLLKRQQNIFLYPDIVQAMVKYCE